MEKDLASIAGLPAELGIDDDLVRTEQRLSIRTESRRYGKPVTVVGGFDDAVDLKALASRLKSKVGAGGTVDGRRIELQGDHTDRLPPLLDGEGYTVVG